MLNASQSITSLAEALSKAQGEMEAATEMRLLKAVADQIVPIPAVNASSALPMPNRFLSKLAFGAGDCWVWRGHVDSLGYGRFAYGNENKAHRISYAVFVGEIPAGMKVLHKCDNRQCVNPDHLFLGTQTDNMRDMASKGRGVYPSLRGQRNPMARLTQDQVNEIRGAVAAGEAQRAMCAKYGVSPMTISRIVRRETWK